VFRISNSIKYRIRSENGIQEELTIKLGGIEQFIQIRGENQQNPVIIFLHGGPASPMGYAAYYYQTGLEDEYTIINYDQRGCGRTYYANDESMEGVTAEQLLADLHELVTYACERFGQEKVIILGHSWGTILGTRYAQEHPEKVTAYIGISQIIDLYDSKIELAKMTLASGNVTKEEDASALRTLSSRMEKVIDYAQFSLTDLMQLIRICSQYQSTEGQMSSLQQLWTGLSSPYMNLDDIRWFLKIMNTETYFALEQPLMDYAFFGFDLEQVGSTYEIPVYYLAGRQDLSVPQGATEAYYETISAPDMDFV